MITLEVKTISNKETIFDKEYVKIKKDTFDNMNKAIDQTKKVMELQPKYKKSTMNLILEKKHFT